MKFPSMLLLAAILCLALGVRIGVQPAAAVTTVYGYNGVGSVIRPTNTSAYTANKLVAHNTAGTAVPTTINTGSTAGGNIITAARLTTTGTGASGGAWNVFLYAAGSSPTLTGLVDGSTYVGPYTADMPAFLGELVCGTPIATNDGSPTYYSECTMPAAQTGGIRFTGSGANTTTALLAVIAVKTGYTPISAEVLSVYLAAKPAS